MKTETKLSESACDHPRRLVCDCLPAAGPLGPAFWRVEIEIDGPVGQVVESLASRSTDELGVQALARHPSRGEIVVIRENLDDRDLLEIVECPIREVAKELRGVVRGAGPPSVHSLRAFPDEHSFASLTNTPPLQVHGDQVVIDPCYVDGCGTDVVFGRPVEPWQVLGEGLGQLLLDRLGERAHELARDGRTT